MLFLSNENQVYQELFQHSIHLGVNTTSITDALQKMVQQNRNKTTSIASLRTYVHSLPLSLEQQHA